jgi:hypothetical protein
VEGCKGTFGIVEQDGKSGIMRANEYEYSRADKVRAGYLL